MALVGNLVGGPGVSGGGGGLGATLKYLLYHGGNDPVEYDTQAELEVDGVDGDFAQIPGREITEQILGDKDIDYYGSVGTVLMNGATLTKGGLHRCTIDISNDKGFVWDGYSKRGRLSNIDVIGYGADYAVHAMSNTAQITCTNIKRISGGGFIFIYGQGGSSLDCINCVDSEGILTNTTSFWAEGKATYQSCGSFVNGGTGFYIRSGSVAEMIGCYAYNSSAGVNCYNSASLKMVGCLIEGATAKGISHLSSGTLEVIGCYINSTRTPGIGIADVHIGSTSGPAKFIGCRVDRWDISPEYIAAGKLSMISSGEEDLSHKIIGPVKVGTPGFSCPVYWGEGAPFITDLEVMSNDNLAAGAWLTHTTAATTAGSLFDGFPDGFIGECLYFKSGTQAPAYAINVDTAMSGGSMVYEYYNGTIWVECPAFCAKTDGALNYIGKYPPEQEGAQNFRLGDHLDDSETAPVGAWTKQVEAEFNSKTGFWTRLRITANYTGTVKIDTVELWGHSGKMSSSGIEYFGNLVQMRDVELWSADRLKPINGTNPGFRDITISQNITLNALLTLEDGKKDDIGGTIDLPLWVDVSRAMQLRSGVVVSNATAGNVDLTIRWNTSFPGDEFNGAAADYPEHVLIPMEEVAEKAYSVSSYRVPALAQPESWLSISYEREATVAIRVEDTFEGDVTVLSSRLRIPAYREM